MVLPQSIKHLTLELTPVAFSCYKKAPHKHSQIKKKTVELLSAPLK